MAEPSNDFGLRPSRNSFGTFNLGQDYLPSIDTTFAPDYSLANMGNYGGLGLKPSANALASTGTPASDSPWYSGMLDSVDKNGNVVKGWGGLGLTALQGLASGYMAMKQYGLMKDNLNFQKDSFYKNYEANKALTNASLADRQNRRNAEAGNLYALTGTRLTPQDTASYMAQYGVK